MTIWYNTVCRGVNGTPRNRQTGVKGEAMAIFTRWGDAVTVSAYHGKHKTTWCALPLMLITTTYADGKTRFAHPISLRADGGAVEIEAALDAAPEVELDADTLKDALKQAE